MMFLARFEAEKLGPFRELASVRDSAFINSFPVFH